MKNFFIAACFLCICLSCSKKTVPSKTTNENNTNNNTKANNNTVIDTASSVIVTADSLAMASVNNIMVIADGYGNLVTPQQSLPANSSGVKYNNLELSKSFTVQQRANLQARYKTVPPRVLYVPEQASSSSLKGSYYIYKKKFWYWKKADGFYYLDPKYYQ